MNNPALYEQANSMPKRDVLNILDDISPKLKWKKNISNILDIGSGDGGVTSMLKKYIPTNFKLLGCDISEKMVNFANDHHCNEQTSFTVLDIAGNIPEDMKGKFDHVFSFYALHWVFDQERVFRNIYDLLSKDGECFTIFIANAPVFDLYRIQSRNNKWSTLLKDAEKYISPYQDSQDPAQEMRKILEKVGYVDYKVECKNLSYTYNNFGSFWKILQAVTPFNIPKDMEEDFKQDYFNILKDLNIVPKYNTDEESFNYKYRLLVVHARKPASEY
ncbi:juvenile hormone acid O-methyltransferase-like [Spodoptera litura]|uniref:Juvenile hormone acid O-methyltransferase-like n=1 Tax=Spodoptera litura TaxID=69820 RepID=A0A9J7IL50_SPOLT|nr:juvenile hormone acid O-methyltransferase-like [Spodoptera litura]